MAVLDRIKEITNKDFKFYEFDTTDEEKLEDLSGIITYNLGTGNGYLTV